jgi:hypothetical protein
MQGYLYSRARKLILRCSQLIVLACIALSPLEAMAQLQPSSPSLLQNPSTGGNLPQFLSTRTPFEFWLTCVIGTLGLLIILILIMALRGVRNTRPEDIARPVIVITVIMSTLMLVTVGYSNEQIAPAFGLFGTIVGYMLGRLSQPSSSTNDAVQASDPSAAKSITEPK